MKRAITLFIISLFMLVNVSALAIYEDEILFREFDWETDIISFAEQVSKEIQPNETIDYELKESSYVLCPAVDTEFSYSLEQFENSKNVEYSVYIRANDNIFVASWPIAGISARAIPTVDEGVVYTNPSESQLIHCTYSFDISKIEDIDAACYDLERKLAVLYGEPDITDTNEMSIEKAWMGGENTYIKLTIGYCDGTKNANSLRLDYGILNAMELVRIINNPVLVVDKSSMDGL